MFLCMSAWEFLIRTIDRISIQSGLRAGRYIKSPFARPGQGTENIRRILDIPPHTKSIGLGILSLSHTNPSRSDRTRRKHPRIEGRRKYLFEILYVHPTSTRRKKSKKRHPLLKNPYNGQFCICGDSCVLLPNLRYCFNFPVVLESNKSLSLSTRLC